MTDYYSSIVVHSDTLDERVLLFEVVGDELSDARWETEYGVTSPERSSDGQRHVYLQTKHGTLVAEQLPMRLTKLLGEHPDVTEIEWRLENHDANYDDVIHARVWGRGTHQQFHTQLVPHRIEDMIAEVRQHRRLGNEANAWMATERLFAALEKGMSL